MCYINTSMVTIICHSAVSWQSKILWQYEQLPKTLNSKVFFPQDIQGLIKIFLLSALVCVGTSVLLCSTLLHTFTFSFSFTITSANH